MPVTSISNDPTARTITVVAEVAAPVGRLWDAYLDPRQLERFWGPPAFPARFIRHDGAAGGRSDYVMTGPDGESHRGYWRWLSVTSGTSFEVEDGFANPDGSPNDALPAARMAFSFEPSDTGSRLITISTFANAADLATVIEMGMEEGLRGAMAQIDDVVADAVSFADDSPTMTQLLGDIQVRVSRVIRGPVDAVWRAYHEPELLRRWLLGPDGWTMSACEVAAAVGDSYRSEWDNGTNHFGFEGELLEVNTPYREVTTERMIGMPEQTTNALTLTPVAAGTLMTLVITYPSTELRDIVLGTGMTDGMEASFRRLESDVLPII